MPEAPQGWGQKGNKGKGKQPQGWGQKGNKGGGPKGGRAFWRREVGALNLADAERRLQRWMDDHPDFIFRPRESVPTDFEEVYTILGENGPQLWKNLRHHLTGDDGEEIAGRVLQYMPKGRHGAPTN